MFSNIFKQGFFRRSESFPHPPTSWPVTSTNLAYKLVIVNVLGVYIGRFRHWFVACENVQATGISRHFPIFLWKLCSGLTNGIGIFHFSAIFSSLTVDFQRLFAPVTAMWIYSKHHDNSNYSLLSKIKPCWGIFVTICWCHRNVSFLPAQ